MSQLNVDTISDELGTGAPDFVTMPSVGGDPVVESGSNSDGQWTRWADGTQQCRFTGGTLDATSQASDTGAWFTNTGSGDSSFTWAYPLGFTAAPVVSPNTTGRVQLATMIAAPTVTDVELGIIRIQSSITGADISVTAIGRWK